MQEVSGSIPLSSTKSHPNDLALKKRFQMWGYSSAGRALAWHARGQRFDPAYLHHFLTRCCQHSFRFIFHSPVPANLYSSRFTSRCCVRYLLAILSVTPPAPLPGHCAVRRARFNSRRDQGVEWKQVCKRRGKAERANQRKLSRDGAK